MKIKLTYPPVEKKRLQRSRLLAILRWPVTAAVILCPLIDWKTGFHGWSLVVLVSLYTAWTMVISPDLVEYNRISQLVRLIASSCMLLAVIELFIASGWALQVIALVCMGGLIAAAILFFTDIDTQKQNMLPMLLLYIKFIPLSILSLS